MSGGGGGGEERWTNKERRARNPSTQTNTSKDRDAWFQ